MGQLTQADPMDRPYCITSCLAIKAKCKGGRKRQTDIPLSSLIKQFLSCPKGFLAFGLPILSPVPLGEMVGEQVAMWY